MGLDDIEKELYSLEGPKGRESRYKQLKKIKKGTRVKKTQTIENNWVQHPESEKERMPKKKPKKRRLEKPPLPFVKIILFLLILFFIAGAYIFYTHLATDKPDKGISLSLDGPAEVLLGIPFEVRINITNESRSALQDVQVDFVLPNGIHTLGSLHKGIVSKKIDNIETGTISQETFQFIALEDEKSAKEIGASLKYSVNNISSRFSQEERYIVNVGESGLRLDTSYPNKIISGEEFNIDFNYNNISQTIFDDVSLVIEYPDSFEYIDSSTEPDQPNTTWAVGPIGSQGSGSLTILGKAFGREGSFFKVSGKLVVKHQGDTFTISQKEASFTIASSPLVVILRVNGDLSYTSYKKDDLKYDIIYTNNTDVGLKDVVITAQVIGDMFDVPTVDTNAFFESISNTMTWNIANTPELELIAPGASGKVSFSIQTKDEFLIRRLSDKNYSVKIKAVVESPTVPFFVASDKTTGVAEIETKIRGNIISDAFALFRDAQWSIVNKGSMPPVVNKSTNFTVHWLVSSEAADLKDISVTTRLEPGVKWTGVVKASPGASLPTFNERTLEVTWLIDKIYANQGIVDEPIETVFQIEATPSILQVNDFVPLIKETNIIATDEFTGEELVSTFDSLTTQLTRDPTITDSNIGKVKQ